MDRNEAYKFLSELVFKGFLVAEENIDGMRIVFKTINDREFDLIKLYAGDPEAHSYQLNFNIYLLVFSVLIIGSKNILKNRESNIEELYSYFLTLPSSLSKKILDDLNALRNSSYEVLKYLEGFSYTNASRIMWKGLNGNLPCSTEFSGIPGTSDLGMNIYQESWVQINKALDYEDDYNRDFSLSLMVASASNPKGARHIRNQFDTSKKMAEDRRKKLAKEGFIDTHKWTPEGWSAPVDTAEELVAELERQMTGVKDKHDLFMERYMKEMREQAERKVREAEERIKAAQAGRDNVLIDGEQRVMTPEEYKKIKLLKTSTTQKVNEEEVSQDDKEKFYKKMGTRILTGR